MNCIVCTEPILPGAATLTYPCLCPPLHTLCALRAAHREFLESHFVGCPHCRTIYMDSRYQPEETTFEQTDTLRADIKNLKKKRTLARRLKAVFTRKLNEVYRQFRERILMSLELIEVERDRAMTELKESPEFLEARKAMTAVYSYESRLKTKHNLGYEEYRDLVGFQGPFGRVYTSSLYMMKRKFRIRM